MWQSSTQKSLEMLWVECLLSMVSLNSYIQFYVFYWGFETNRNLWESCMKLNCYSIILEVLESFEHTYKAKFLGFVIGTLRIRWIQFQDNHWMCRKSMLYNCFCFRSCQTAWNRLSWEVWLLIVCCWIYMILNHYLIHLIISCTACLSTNLFLIYCSAKQLDLPRYSSKEQIKEKLLRAIRECDCFGFGVVGSWF